MKISTETKIEIAAFMKGNDILLEIAEGHIRLVKQETGIVNVICEGEVREYKTLTGIIKGVERHYRHKWKAI